MTDLQALLAAIKAQPDEDTPRLAYADAIEEQPARYCPCPAGCRNGDAPGDSWRDCQRCGGSGQVVDDGDALRAAFIRVQCRLARWVHPELLLKEGRLLVTKGKDDHGRVEGILQFPTPNPEYLKSVKAKDELESEASRLFLRAWEQFQPGRADGTWDCSMGPAWGVSPDTSMSVVRRGFVDEVVAPWKAWAEHGEDLCDRHPVRKVTLTTVPDIGECRRDPQWRRWLCQVADKVVSVGERSVMTLRADEQTTERMRALILEARWPGVAFEVLNSPSG